MSAELSPREIEAGRIWVRYFQDFMKQLKTQDKINPKRVKEMKNYFRMYNFANQSAIHINFIDGIARDQTLRKKFLKTNPDMDPDLLDEIWFDMLVVATLRSYWLIEISLITLLRDVEYGKKGIVEGRENLGRLKAIIEKDIGITERIDWSAIDTTFRNSLAHGWYYRKKQNFIFYRNSRLTNGKNLSYKKLITKTKTVQLYALVIAGLVGDWTKLKDFGSKDPLRKKKR
ncbi:MAG: hypothetical protein IIC67_10955 [Thaumarchaeota archaeon]|nr:hypothetical protein [Nitrososphaerota archaeon]